MITRQHWHLTNNFAKMMNYMPEMTFNVDHGYLEGLLRGFKSGILRQNDYLNLVQCETLEGRVFFFKQTSCRVLWQLPSNRCSQVINLMQLIFIYPNLSMDLMNSDGVFSYSYAACYKFCREFSLYISFMTCYLYTTFRFY